MPKPHTFPTLFDEALQLNISKLKQWGYLKENNHQRGNCSWSRTNWGGTHDRGNISFTVNMRAEKPYIELDYKYGDEPRKYKVMLVWMLSNLGNGKVWYFHCPSTNKRCRKLYSIGGYFLHREAFNGCMYESQTQTKKWRNMEKVYGCYFDSENCYKELYSKHFKKYYKGKPTKRYAKLKKIIDASERIDHNDIQRLMIYGP